VNEEDFERDRAEEPPGGGRVQEQKESLYSVLHAQN